LKLVQKKNIFTLLFIIVELKKQVIVSVEAMQIMNLVKSLPLSERLYIVELIFKDLREQTNKIAQEEKKRKREKK